MKKTLLVFVSMIAGVFLMASPVVPYNYGKPPGISLPEAYQRATDALGSQTNGLHCLSAKVSTDFNADGGWQFTFYSTNARPKWVTVDFSGKIHIEDTIFR